MRSSAGLITAAAIAVIAIAPQSSESQPNTALVVQPHEQAPRAVASRRTGPVTIDGRLDEDAWKAAQPITDFRQYDPNEGQPATEKTEARILVDDEAIYVGMRMYDRQPQLIRSQLARRDESVEGDIVEVTFDSYHDHVSAYLFRLSAGGARRDATVTSNNEDDSWDAVWEGRTSIDSLGWTAEFRIPLSQLRYNRNVAEQVWGLQLGRNIARKAEVDQFSFTPKSQTQGINRYGHLTGLGNLRSVRKIELVPYALAKTTNPSASANDPFHKRNEIKPGVGLDAKIGLTSNLTLDATFNPDFGQVEVDPEVVNLSAFETFFPERRPFFIEGASIFSFGEMRTNNRSGGFTFFHTRRIGREPQRSIGGPDVAFVDAPDETTIAAATKLTGRSRSGWSVGVLDAVTTRETAKYRDIIGTDHTATVEPLSNYFIGRVKRDLRQGNSTIGFAATAVNRDLSESSLEPLFLRSAYVGGFDWQHAWSNRRWAFDGAFAVSQNLGTKEAIADVQLSSARYFQRPDKKHYRFDPARTSLSGYITEMTLAKLSGLHWMGSVTFEDYSPSFDINESGFMEQTDLRSIAPLIQYRENRPGKHIRNWAQYLFWNPTWNYDGDMTFNGVGAITLAELKNFWDYFLRFDWRPPVVDPGLTRGGPTAGVVTGGDVQIEIDSDRRKRYTYGLFSSYSFNVAGGRGLNIQPSVTYRPTTALRLTLQPTFNATHAMGQYVTRVTDPKATQTYGARYVFATLRQRQLAMVTRVDWTFTPTLSLQLFAQPLIASGDFYDYKEFARPRGFDFRVYGRDAGTIAQDPGSGGYTVDPDGSGAAPSFTFGNRDFNIRSLRGNAVLRWEYRPGSALFFVWQQSRSGVIQNGEFDFGRDFDALWSTRPENVFVVKGTWWIGR